MASDDEQHLQDEKGKKPRKEKTNGGSGKTKKFLVKKKRPRDGANVDKEKAIRKAKAKVARTKSQERLANLPKPSLNGDYQTVEQQKSDGYTVLESSELDDVTSEVTRSYFTDDVDNQRAQQFIEEHSTQFEDQSSYQTDQTDQWDQQSDQTDQTDQMSNSGRKWKKGEVFMTPQMMHALKMSQVQSQVEYQRAMNELRGRYNLDDCLSTLPEVKNAKRATHFASKNAYREGLDEVLEKYKGFQKLPFMDYHDVQRSVKAAAISDKKYKEDWEYDRSVVCFPATLTPGYDRLVEAQRNASTNVYKDGLESTLENVHFDPTKTDLYKTIQDNLKYVSSKEYKADYEENKAHYHPLALTAEMVRSKAMQGITNWTAYTAYARKLWEHYHLVVPVPIITQAIQTAKMTSDKWYKADYHRECVGKSGPANIANYPLLQQARKAAGQASQIEYRREADKFKSHYTMPVDSPDILRAKSAAEKSDIKYKKQKFQTVADFQGFQRMDPRHHPVVQHAAKNAELQSQKAYTEDWEYDKQMIYFPAHITPGYEAASDVKHVQSDSAYKKEFEHSKAKNNYDVTSTKQYDDIKSSMTDAKYKEEYLKNRGNVTQVAETSEMLLSKELKPILSKKAYSEKSKEAQKTVHFGPGTQELSHAVDSQKQASSNQYKQEYKHTMVGKPPADPTSAYPEHTLHSKMTKLASKPEYTRESEKSMHVNQLPVDAPEFIRAKQSALQSSDIEYKKDMSQTVDQYRGYQTLDPQDHPMVQRANQVAGFSSEKAYKEDWEYDKQMIYFPAHITPGYEAASDVKKVQSDVSYKKEFEGTKSRNDFKVTDTDRYKEMKKGDAISSDVKYKEEYERNKGKGQTQVAETSEMVLSKQLRPVQSKNQYEKKSKEMHQNLSVHADGQEIAHAVTSQRLASPQPYRKEYKEGMVGRGPNDPSQAYPEHELHKKASNLASNADYQKEAAKMMTQHHLPADAPEFIRAKEAAKNASDIEYQKQKQETIANYRGFQTMDGSEHPVVQRGIKAAELASNTLYTEDWEYDKQMIYFPAHITPGYEAASDVKKVQSDVAYKKEFESGKAKNEFRPTDTERYREMKKNDAVSSDVKYREEFLKNKGKGAQVAETPEMILSKELGPVQSKQRYEKESKQMHKTVNIGPDVQNISHSIAAQKLSSDHPYTAEYRKGVVGQGRTDPANSYPEVQRHKELNKNASPAEYHKEAEKMMHTHNLPLDYPEFVRARETAKNASDRHYQKQRKEVIDSYKGFQTMDSKDHPIVQHGIKSAELISNTLYTEDWEYDKQMIYFPAHITPGYEAASDVKKVQSDAAYKGEFEKNKDKNTFKVTDTEAYKSMKETEKSSSEVKYREDYEKNRGKGLLPLAESNEMTRSKELRPVQSNKMYSEKSKEMHKNVNVGSDVQNIAHAVSAQKVASDQPYHQDYVDTMVGKGPVDPAKSYPEYDRLREVNKIISVPEYHKEAEKMMHTHNLPLDYPEFVRARETAKNASDRHYQKQRKEVIDSYKGFQTMDSKDHPIVQHGIKSAELISNALYTEDWEYDKQMIYFPAHITPGYEAASDVKKVQSDAAYKGEFEKNKDKNTFKVTDTEAYKSMKETEKSSSEVKYREEFLKNKGKGAQVAETHEMILSKELGPVQSKQRYEKKSKQMHKNVNIGPDVQEIARAVESQKLSSDQSYRSEYEKTMVGRPPADMTNSYPEYDHLRKVSKQSSKAEYQKEAEKILHTHNLPLDYPEFVRAKVTAKNASDRHYQKQRKEVIDSYKGFQTMDSKDHPVVQQGIKAAELASGTLYKEDWEYDKQMIYFPAHITPGYEAASDVKKVQSDVAYKDEYEKNKERNNFLMTDTERYKAIKEGEKTASEVKYREEFLKNKGKGAQVSETPEMVLSKELGPVQSKQRYEKESKQMHKNVNIGPDVQGISHALGSQKLASEQAYHADYAQEMVGKAPADVTTAYPEYERLRDVSKLNSKALYVKEADKMMHTHNLPLDYPEFVRARETAKNASDRHYQKQRKEVIDSYKGFQTMDSKDHPVVQQGIKAAELASGRLYTEDWEYEKSMIYYPVHITPGYEQAIEASKCQSKVGYSKEAGKSNERNEFKVTDTEQYQAARNLLSLVSGSNYTAEHLASRGQGMHPISETPEMALSNQVKPLLSNKAYTREAKRVMQKYNLDSSTQNIAHALVTQKTFSPQEYVGDFKRNVVGKAPSDLANSYPEYTLARNVSNMSSKKAYVKEADKLMHTHNIPLDYPEFVRAKQNAKNASDAEYTKQKNEVINQYRGFQTMDSKDHPIVQQGIKAAELVSNALYKEDWEYDKQMIYFPAHITPGYEAAVQASKSQSDVSYKKQHLAGTGSNNFKVTDTEQYKSSKELTDVLSDKKYKEAYELEKGSNRVQVKETAEMRISKSVAPFLSHKIYGDEARRKMQEYNLDSSMQAIAQALSVQKMTSQSRYLDDFKRNVIGKAPSDVTNSYPEYDLARKVSKQTSKALYVKEADKMMHTHNLPLDYPEFVRAKQNAKNASDAEYQKQRNEVISTYRGFQTMDSKEHPVVQHGIRVADIISDRKYKEDYLDERDLIYYPVHLTPGYEAAVKSSENQSEVMYRSRHAKEGGGNHYLFTDTEAYKTTKGLDDLKDHTYKGEYRDFQAMERTPEMEASAMLKNILSNVAYTKEAKKRLDAYNIDLQDQRLSQAMHASQLGSDLTYRRHFAEKVKGQAPNDVTIAHPEYDHARKVSHLMSRNEYVKAAEKGKHRHHLPVDYPEFVRARECAKNASDAEYQKQKKQVIANYRGFQTMDSQDHPVVQQGIKAADLISHHKYIEDYMIDRSIIYYPVHLTPGYEAATKASQYQSELKYKDGQKQALKNFNFDPTKTDAYKTAKETQGIVQEHAYKEDSKKKLETDFTPLTRTYEMEVGDQMRALAPSEYQKRAKKLMHKYHLNVELPEITHAICMSQVLSKNNYLKDYNEKVKGSAPQDLANSYPEYIHARNVTKQTSKKEYTKTGDEIRHQFSLPVDTPELNRAKQSAKIASDMLYKKQRKEVIDSYKGFQTMDSKDHPVVQQGIKAADLMSERKYKEDYMDERDMIYFPVHLTAGYEAAVKSSENQSETAYKAKHLKEKQSNRFNPVQTDQYEAGKERAETMQDKNYKKGLERLSSEMTAVSDSVESQHLRSMRELLSNKTYTEDAKKSLDKYNLNADVIQIAHALATAPLSSDVNYRRRFNDEMKGRGVSGAGVEFYPDHIKAIDNTKMASQSEYKKENEKLVHHYTMPLDTPELNRAKESAINASDLLYKRQKQETIANYRGFQTMDSKDHPVVQQGIKAAELMSERKYKEDYMEDRNLIYYPVHLTAGYEAAVKASQYINGPSYQKAYHRDRNDVHYDVTKTDTYKAQKDLEKLSDALYKTDPSSLRFTQVPDDVDMTRARMVKPLVSYWFYKDQAKKMLDKYHVDVADQRLVHALHSNQLASDIKYRRQWAEEVKGRMGNENMDSYPGYKHAIAVGKNVSQTEYAKGVEKHRNDYTIPADMPSIKHAKAVDGMISNVVYGKSRKDTIENFRGFQTMDSKNHPVVQRGIKAADLISERKYKADYMEDRNLIYYPVHLTAGYEAAVKSSKFASDADYKSWYNRNIRGRGNFPVNLTPGYEQSQQVKPYISDTLYKAKYEKTKSEFTPVVDANDMQHIKFVQPWLSQSKYKKQAREVMGKYHLDVEVPEIAHALYTSSMFSPAAYKRKFEKEIRGVGASNFEKSPFIKQPLKASKLLSKSEYTKKAEEGKQHYTLGLETSDIQQAMIADKLTSDVEYKKGGKEATAACQAFQKMSAQDIPSYKKFRDVAANNSDVKYREEYNDMKKYVYFPYHITPEYESKADSNKALSQQTYGKSGRDNLPHQNFLYHEVPAYVVNKELQGIMSVRNVQKQKQEMQDRGYKISNQDFHNEHVREVQKRVSNNLYKAAAREVMDKYNITAELPEIRQALQTTKLVSDNVYKEEHRSEKGSGMTYNPDIPSFKLARDVKALASDNIYKDEASKALHQYSVVADAPDLLHAKVVAQQQSGVEYKRKGKEDSAKCRAYQFLLASEQRDVAHARKVNDIISPAKYREEYNEIRNIIYFPVHLTDGYESAVKANKFASAANYKQNWMKNRYRNNYKVHETEGYKLDRAIQNKISNIAYKAEYRANLGKCPYVTETMERAHQRDMKELSSEKRYRQSAHEIMDKYHLITDEPRMVNAIQAMKLQSAKKYREDYEAGKTKIVTDILQTPSVQLALNSSKLTSEIPYKEAALKDLPKVHIPEDATSIKHAQEVGKLTSEITYKKDAKENAMQGYKKVAMKDHFTLNRLDEIKDLSSEVNYKRDLYEQRGQSIPVVDTPENTRVQKVQKLQSDKTYKKDLEKLVKGHGLTTDVTPQLKHAKEMVALQSEQKYKEGTKDQHEWKSHEAINTPTAVKAREAHDLTSDFKYKENYEKEKGQGCNVITPAISHATDVGKIVSENAYKEKHKEDSAVPPAYTVMPSTLGTEHVQAVGDKISERKYREEHLKEDIGRPSELKDSVQIQQDKKTTELQSNIEYKKQGEIEAEKQRAYLKCLNETPQAIHAKKVRDILSDFKYKEAYETDKGILFYPYSLTPQYETQVKAGKLQSQNVYTKKADKERHNFHLTTDQPNFKQAKEATDIFSDLKYRQPHQGRPPKFRDVKDVPSILHSKKMQDLFSKKRYRSEYEQIKDRYHLDVTTPSIENAKRADKILSDVTYKEAHNKEKGQGLTAYQDSLQMKHLRTLPDQLSDIKYKQDLVLSRGKVIQVSDTPWLQSSKRAQRFISHIKYGKDSGRKLKCRFQPEKFNKHVKNVTESISDSKYRDDYETFFRGNLIPLPETPETRHALKNSKLLSQSEYQQKARDGMKTYLVIPDDPEFKRLREAAGYHSDVTYKGEAVKQQKNFTSVAETPALLKAKESQELQSESAYKGEAKKKLATEYRLPVEGTTVMQQQQHASTLTSNNTYKQKGEQVKHDPTAFKNLKETRDTKHAKKIAASQSEIQYKKSAKQGLQNIHPSAEDPWMMKAMETNTNISDIKYKAKDKDLAHKYKIKGTDNFIKHAMSVRDKISDAKYKESYLDSVGLCWCLPDEKGFQHARKVADLYSDNKYKEEAKKLKGKYHITTDTPEFERLKRVQDGVSESKYKEGADERSKEFTILESTPDIKHATNVSSLVSKNKYKAAHEKSKGSYTLIEKDPSIQHAVNVNNMQSQNSYKKKAHDMQKDGFTVLAKRRDTEHQQKVQMNVSNVQYRKEARENVDKDFTVVEKRPDVQHAVNTAKMQSNIHYKQKLDGKNLEMMKTPGMKCALDANKLQSNLEYRKEFDNEIKGKGWKFIKDTPAQKHAENIGKVQSQFNYTKKHRDNIGKGFTTVTDRPDIVHATSRNEQVSDYEYRRRHRDMTGKGYTFTPDNPSQVHAEEASNFQSELKYRRKYGNTGKSWQADDSPFIGHYKEAQKLVDNIDYRKSAREINARGTSAASEDTPASLHYKKAQEILDDRRYKADYEKTVRGRGMTFDLHGTPSMDHIRRAEDIKSEKLYKANYETTMKGRPTAVMDAPQLLNAQNATHLISDAKYKQLHNESRGQMLSMSDTPEMRRVRENQKAISQVSYKAASEELRGKYAAAVMDTPELRRVRQNTKNYSNIAYKDSSAAQSCSVSVLDTPEFRTAKQNTQNFSQIKYQADRANMRGKVTAVADDLTMRRVKQATLISSDLAYKGAKGKVEEMEKMRANVVQENQRKSQRSTANASNVRNAASLNQVRSASANAVHSSGQTVIRSEPMKRWRRNPGSIFDYDPSEYETDTEYEEGKPGRNGAYASDYGQSDADIDYRKLISLDPSTLKGQATPWTDFVLGKEFKHVEAPNSVLNYQNAQTQRQNYTSMPRQKQYRAIYDYAAADDDEIDLRDGDVIVNAQSIDEGWMFGTVLRSGQTGMLPANYVQLVL